MRREDSIVYQQEAAEQGLRAARERIEDPDCWLKDEREEDGAYCAMGALGVAGGHGPGRQMAYDALARIASELGYAGRGGCPVAALNDAPETTHADVLALFDLAISAVQP